MRQLSNDFRGKRYIAAALFALVALFAITACGGGDSSDSSTSEATTASAPVITKKQLIKKADAICLDIDEEQQKAFNAYQSKNGPLVFGETPEMRKVMKEVLLPPIGVELEEIAALGVPAGDEAELTKIMTGWESALKAAMKNPGLLINGEGPFTKSGELAKKYGFKRCSQIV